MELEIMDIKIARTNKRLSSFAGLRIVTKLLKSSRIQSLVDSSMPKLISGTRRSQKKFTDLMLGFIAGADCLDDMERLGYDAGFSSLCGDHVYTPKSYGDFLRSFKRVGIKGLQGSLMKLAFESRRQVIPNDLLYVFDMDSAENPQFAKKMEGVEMNYKGTDCLDTLDVFDQYGFQYHIDVRPGATRTNLNCEQVIHKLMSEFMSHREKYGKKYKATFRADSGYYTSGFVNACTGKGADVVLRVVADPHNFPKIVGQIHDWKKEDPEDPERIKFYDGRECEIGTTRFRPQRFVRSLRYVVMRAKREPSAMFPDHVEYDYFAFATSLSDEQMAAEEVIRFYRKRGNAENFIRENKNGLDLKHYPCLKLDANRAYALIGAFSYNLMRLMALTDNKEKPVFAKNIRFKWIQLPCTVARTSRETVFKYMDHHYREVSEWIKKLHSMQFEYG